MTYFLHDDAFIKWKVTIINALFALALFVGEVIRKPILKALLGQHLPVEGSAWSKISWLWIGFFLLCAWLNWYIAFFMSQDTWVNFKVFGLMGMSLAMTAVTVFYLYKHLPEEKRREFKK